MTKQRNVADEILRVVPRVMRVLASEIRREPGGLAPAHFRLLVMLAKRPRSLTELAASQSVSLATMSNSISVLANRGWIVRRKDPQDRRKLALDITDDGRKILEDVHERAQKRLEDLVEPLDGEQRRNLLRGLELMYTVFSHYEVENIGLRNEER